MTAKANFSHFAICAADLDRSFRFYTEGLGFTHKRSIDELGPPFDTLMEVPGATLQVHQITCGDMMMELVGMTGVETEGSVQRRPMNQRGFTHMTLSVDDVDEAIKQVEAYGGTVHAETRVDTPYGPLIFCTDPDGVRIELMQHQN